MELRKSLPPAFIVALLAVFSSALAASPYSCDSSLVSTLPQGAFQSSSHAFDSQAAHFAHLNRIDGGSGWSPKLTDRNPWLQVDLQGRMEVTAVATQGRYGTLDWVSSYMLLHSDSGRVWKQYRQEDGVGKFTGNSDADSVVHHKLPQPVRTRFLRFVPLDWSSNGWVGLRVDVYGCAYKSYLADFDGRSSLLYRFNQKSMSTVKDVIVLRFKSRQADGVLLHGEGQRGDYITLELHRGRLALHLNLGESRVRSSSARAVVTLGSLLDDQHWHSVLIERFNKQVNFTLDRYTQHFRTKGDGDSLEVDYELSFGGIPLPGKPGTFLRRNFHGCMENLYYNGVNVIDLAKRRKPQIYSVGNVTFSCSEPQLVAATFLSSSGSFLSLAAPPPSAVEGLSVRFQFRTWNGDSLLFSGQLFILTPLVTLKYPSIGQKVNDGLWHSVSLSTRGLQISMTLDSEPASTIQLLENLELDKSLFFGGCPRTLDEGNCKNPTMAFQGCMRFILINNQPINILLVQRGLLGNYNQLQFDICGIRDRCLPNFCEHGGRCSQTWSSFYCDCSGTGYSGATCHNSIYENSCEGYRLAGSSSGYFSIDPDGSGPMGPVQVYCNMTENKVWTVVNYNGTNPVRVQGSSVESPYIMHFNYSASPEQLHALVVGSDQCQQEVMYRCRKSRLYNPWDGTPLSWWRDRGGEKRTYWSGSLPGVQQCSCSLEENCLDMSYFCNCDSDQDTWYTLLNDTGLLSYRDHLPVSEIIIGDTHRPGSEAIYSVGPLRCHGYKSLWNAVSFYQEFSYIHFPAPQVELSADISFYFKTGAPSGVFLENLGLRDFIKVELSSQSAVTFSFDVGDGPVLLTVKSPVPLNDRQWHWVRVERNVKEASVQVDQLPLRFLEAPSDGHIRLQLTSQLFVGGMASRQRGFLGCIRALSVNGVSLDLEEKAKLTPGVSPGCPGHCGKSAELCHNQGRCIEQSSGYVCDCTHSAFGGPSCKEEVSVSFEKGSSVTYTFQEPFSFIRNSSSQASSMSTGYSKAVENVAFSFQTTQAPAMLLIISTFSQQYVAVILAHNGSLQLWYQLHKERRPDVFSPRPLSLADGRLHQVRIHREAKDIYLQENHKYTLSSDSKLNSIRSVTLGNDVLEDDVALAGTKGFVGCFSSVQYNHVAPLKAALLNRGSSLVSVRGQLVESNCGALADLTTSNSHADQSGEAGKDNEHNGSNSQHESAVIGAVVTAIVLGTYHTNEAKGTEFAESADAALRTDPALHDAMDERKKEYFI
uniref:Contactin-associated protein-like 5 n=1 Tax=Denticeps clupeoides TaxID=299321 RepID=A0AAY4AYS3_9TELE